MARLSIRRSVYRTRSGYLISGTDTLGRRCRIFTETMTSAEQIKRKIRGGLSVELADFYA